LIHNPFTLALNKIKKAYVYKHDIKEDTPLPCPIVAGEKPRYFDADGKYAMGWGTLFEPLLCEYISRKMNLKIDARSASHFDGPYRFSPDGAFIDANGDCGILEMKNPFMRPLPNFDAQNNDILTAPHMLVPNSSEIPAHYHAQLQSGLRAMPFAKYAYFVEAIYRRVHLNSGKPSGVVFQKVEAYRSAPLLDRGVIGFYHTNGCGNRENAIPLTRNYDDTAVIDVLSHLHCNDAYIPYYFGQDGLPNATVEDLPETWQDKPLYAYMSWGMFGIHSARVNRDDAFFSPTITNNATCIAEAVHTVLYTDCNPADAIRSVHAKIICKKNIDKELQSGIDMLEKLCIKNDSITHIDDKIPCIPTSQPDAES
jgi:hypothetical protein